MLPHRAPGGREVNWPGHAIGFTHPAIDAICDATERLGPAALVGIAEMRELSLSVVDR